MVTDAERTEINATFFIRCSSSDESRLDGDEGLRGACEELIKCTSNEYWSFQFQTYFMKFQDYISNLTQTSEIS